MVSVLQERELDGVGSHPESVYQKEKAYVTLRCPELIPLPHGQPPRDDRRLNPTRAAVEIALLVFLSYSVQLMREFIGVGGHGKSMGFAVHDILTIPVFLIAVISALIGCALIEYFRSTAV